MPPGMAEAVRKRKVVAGAGPPLPLPGCNRFSPLDLISPLWKTSPTKRCKSFFQTTQGSVGPLFSDRFSVLNPFEPTLPISFAAPGAFPFFLSPARGTRVLFWAESGPLRAR
jgi:hypothetical protein